MGVAGQTAAIALQQKGWKVSMFFFILWKTVYHILFIFLKVNLYEQSAKVLSPIGAGIALSGGALCLDALGVGHTWR